MRSSNIGGQAVMEGIKMCIRDRFHRMSGRVKTGSGASKSKQSKYTETQHREDKKQGRNADSYKKRMLLFQCTASLL